MAPRLNIEASWWTDPLREKLAEKVGSTLLADAVAIRAWLLSQEYWAKGRRLIPRPKFDLLPHCEALLSSGMAKVEGDFVYIEGSKEKHEWLMKRSESGKLGAEITNKKVRQTPAKRRQTPPSSSFSGSNSKTNTENPLTPRGVLEIWNSNRGALPEGTTLNPSRERAAKSRVRENGDPAYWEKIVKAIASNPFCRGENDRGWVATIDYLLRPNTHVRVAELLESKSTRTLTPKNPEEF